MLRGRYDSRAGAALFSAAAEATQLAGWASYDVGLHGLAQQYLVQALRLAAAAGDRALPNPAPAIPRRCRPARSLPGVGRPVHRAWGGIRRSDGGSGRGGERSPGNAP